MDTLAACEIKLVENIYKDGFKILDDLHPAAGRIAFGLIEIPGILLHAAAFSVAVTIDFLKDAIMFSLSAAATVATLGMYKPARESLKEYGIALFVDISRVVIGLPVTSLMMLQDGIDKIHSGVCKLFDKK